MRKISTRSTYSRWDGTQSEHELADEFIGEMVDDLLDYGDLSWSIRNLLSRGLKDIDGSYGKGLRDIRKQLREVKRQRLDQFDMSTVLEDIEDRLREVLALENLAIDNLHDSVPDTSTESEVLAETMSKIANEHREKIANLPEDAAGRMKELGNYDFLSPDAQQKYQELLNSLRQAMGQKMLSGLQEIIRDMGPDDIQRMKEMLKSLNEMLAKKLGGDTEEGFNEFMHQFGDMFGDFKPDSLDELVERLSQSMAAAQSLLQSLSFEQRSQLQELLNGVFNDSELSDELENLSATLEFLGTTGRAYRFRGDEHIDLQAAMQLMDELHEIDDLMEQLQRADTPESLDALDRDALRKILGEDAADSVEELSRIKRILEEAGYLRKKDGENWAFTPRGMRLIAHKALNEIYSQLKKHQYGNHAVPEEGQFGERIDQPKPYEFGDPMHLNLPRTIRNAVEREGPSIPIRLKEDDFEVYRTELLTSTATAILVDSSWSMFLRDAFRAAKKVSMALHQLIQSQYPKDSLYIIGFAEYAKLIRADELPFLDSDQYVMGTNMEHALLLAEKALRKHVSGSKQILMISDGEPTAHLENGRARFAYPPTRQTLRATSKAARYCARKGIVINTFMLDSSPHLRGFVDELTRSCGGRVFFTTPNKLGEYILVDYLQNKRKRLARSS